MLVTLLWSTSALDIEIDYELFFETLTNKIKGEFLYLDCN